MSVRIKCPHCGAGNRDSRESETCWQCGESLWTAARRPTYRLDSMPPMHGTTALRPDMRAVVREAEPSARPPAPWKLWAAGIVALGAFVAFCALLVVYLRVILAG